MRPVEAIVSNLTKSQSSAHQLSKGNSPVQVTPAAVFPLTHLLLFFTETAKDLQRLKFAVENNKDQLTSGNPPKMKHKHLQISCCQTDLDSQMSSLSLCLSVFRQTWTLRCPLCPCVSGTNSAGCCSLGWDQSGSSCYFFSKTAMSWHDARDWCNGHESHLVVLISDEEWVRHSVSSGTFYWIGLTDEKSGRWEWVNQTPYESLSSRRWKPGQPDSWTGHGLGPGDEDCAHIHNDGRLNDIHCTSRLRFICQRHSQRT
uniref:C-type lectin domain-containing protein n=1 Tax=Kryptolebias marmoratus TaxID=37003 RepID=A0A3Q3A463_KRYMA